MLEKLSGLKIIGAKDIWKHMKNSNDSRVSIAALCVGAAAGTMGPVIFLANGESVTQRSLIYFDLVNIHGEPAGSSVIMTPSGYMTDKAW
jgi:hypothetical protein